MAKKSFTIVINEKYCKRCGLCYYTCPTHTIVGGKFGKPEIEDMTKCIGCLQCERICPDFAINVEENTEQDGGNNG